MLNLKIEVSMKIIKTLNWKELEYSLDFNTVAKEENEDYEFERVEDSLRKMKMMKEWKIL